ncbi:GatB/YqeY domain-containing protein [Coriobacterium glomerans PW2]|uniref:GatB/YqeY domain-containing protein n=1 Tax=Coriobacterium glomerans (strain ATCC 49209 / DSM 20642 / JCM 10262 / PW2) TaxID=700015 RepID=F2N9A0_CORGP|nr:GatB/YqeY domain-containing protein [Coriobacterium glomerans]AEB07848.1 GatB/YqeY domain-containing protein [Coriobacterium glomerans PW2]
MTGTELHNEMIAAMKSKDKTRLSIVRQVMGELRNIEVNERRDITEQDVSNMIKRLIKQTGETLEMSKRAGNDEERTARLAEQVSILESLLPEQVSGEKLRALVDQTINEIGARTRRDTGRVMGALAERTGGDFDKAQAAKQISSRLS